MRARLDYGDGVWDAKVDEMRDIRLLGETDI